MSRRKTEPFISPTIVRVFSVIFLIIDVAVIWLVATNFDTLGNYAWLLILGAVASMYFPYKSIRTGDPEWIMLDLLLPG